jgi:diguanylate cyclase (GGDEF)-like protein
MTDAARLERRLERERQARREAERIAEETTRRLYDRQQELLVLEAVAAAANRASTLEEPLEVAVERLAQHTGWPVGHAWVLTAAGDALRPAGAWHVSAPELHGQLRDATTGWVFRPGEGLPGRVLAEGTAIWLDAEETAALPRRPQGLHTAFAFPVLADGRVVAVLEFFARLSAPPEERLQSLARHVAVHLERVAERLAARDRIAHQALHDGLTGLPNRTLFEDHLGAALRRARRRATSAAVLFLDVDRFKLVNDTLGHRVGDELLRQTADRLRSAVRASDTVARFGGDEFAICCEDLTDERHALTIAHAVQRALSAPCRIGGEEHALAASIGIAVAVGHKATAETLLRDADMAMYRAKELGRGRCEIFDDRLRERIEARVRTERELRAAIERDELRLLYQPVYDVATGAIASVEALVRWQHPERGLLGPGEFLPVAEESGLILDLGEVVLREACRQAARWRAELGDRAPLPININLAARQLSQPALVETVRAALAESGARAEDIGLEITESAIIENTLLAAETLDRLKLLGVHVLLDDFGTGYSSLSYLQRLPVDILKIDRSFVAPLGARERDDAIVAAIVGMAQALGITVVAEGVETELQAGRAADLGCSLAQGFFFDRPLPAAEIAALCGEPGARLAA